MHGQAAPHVDVHGAVVQRVHVAVDHGEVQEAVRQVEVEAAPQGDEIHIPDHDDDDDDDVPIKRRRA